MLDVIQIVGNGVAREEYAAGFDVIHLIAKEPAALLNGIGISRTLGIARHIGRGQLLHCEATIEHFSANKNVHLVVIPLNLCLSFRISIDQIHFLGFQHLSEEGLDFFETGALIYFVMFKSQWEQLVKAPEHLNLVVVVV